MAEAALPRLKMNFYVEIDWGNENKKEIKNDPPNKNDAQKEQTCNFTGERSQHVTLEREIQPIAEKPTKIKRRRRSAKTMTETTNEEGDKTSTNVQKEPKRKQRKQREPMKCPSCDLVFEKKSALARHSLTHSGEKPYSCYLCHTGFSLPHNLARHMRRHAAPAAPPVRRRAAPPAPAPAKLFHCHACTYKCPTRSLLKVHMRTHTGEKPYGCTYCPYRSALKCNLKTHILTHTLEKPFSCTICDYKCARRSTLKVHARGHVQTVRQPLPCPLCPRTFLRRNCLVGHMRAHQQRASRTSVRSARAPSCAATASSAT